MGTFNLHFHVPMLPNLVVKTARIPDIGLVDGQHAFVGDDRPHLGRHIRVVDVMRQSEGGRYNRPGAEVSASLFGAEAGVIFAARAVLAAHLQHVWVPARGSGGGQIDR